MMLLRHDGRRDGAGQAVFVGRRFYGAFCRNYAYPLIYAKRVYLLAQKIYSFRGKDILFSRPPAKHARIHTYLIRPRMHV